MWGRRLEVVLEGWSSSCLLEDLSTIAAVVEENISMMSLFYLVPSANLQYCIYLIYYRSVLRMNAFLLMSAEY